MSNSEKVGVVRALGKTKKVLVSPVLAWVGDSVLRLVDAPVLNAVETIDRRTWTHVCRLEGTRELVFSDGDSMLHVWPHI